MQMLPAPASALSEARELLGRVHIIIGYILGLYRNNGKEDGNYYLGFRVYSPPEVQCAGYCCSKLLWLTVA